MCKIYTNLLTFFVRLSNIHIVVNQHSLVAQLAEQQTVNLWVRSSSLRGGAKPSFNKLGFFYAPLAQLDRAVAS